MSQPWLSPDWTGVLLLAAYAVASFPVASPGQTFDARLRSPGGDLTFAIKLPPDNATRAMPAIVNGEEEILISDFEISADSVTLRFPHYHSVIKAVFSADRRHLDGIWSKKSGAKTTELPLSADLRQSPDSPPVSLSAARSDQLDEGSGAGPFSGRWRVQFESSPDIAVGIFNVVGSRAAGTFLTTTGDYRYLAGEVSGGKLRLATFDGAHAFLFDAVIQTDGSIAGDFWSGNSWHETWTAIRDDRAELPDGFDEVHLTGPADWSKVMVQDNQGQRLSLADAKVFGELTIVNVFGSWCPNCHDEAAYLVELDQKYASSGLHIVGLAFEASGEFDQDISQVGRYAARHSVGYPLFLAGESDKEKVAKALPFLDKFKAFPTSLFVDRSGKVIAVYSGFSGPATGQAHEDLKRRFEEIIRRELRD